MLLISLSRVYSSASSVAFVFVCLLCFVQLHLSRSPSSVLCVKYLTEENKVEDFLVTKVNDESSSLNVKQPQYEAQVSSGTPTTKESEDMHIITTRHEDLMSASKGNVKLNDTILGERDSEGNQTIIEGRGAKFKCTVFNINDKKLSWFKSANRLLLAYNDKVIASLGNRVKVSQQANSVYNLLIDNVKLADQGEITCQVNTNPTQAHSYKLDVVQPPQINEKETTTHLEPVAEFSSVQLRCEATGTPMPTIKWRRESQVHLLPMADSIVPKQYHHNYHHSKHKSYISRVKRDIGAQIVAEGPVLKFDKVSRHDMGFYVCIASNGVPPSVSQRIFLPVSYVPEQVQVERPPKPQLVPDQPASDPRPTPDTPTSDTPAEPRVGKATEQPQDISATGDNGDAQPAAAAASSSSSVFAVTTPTHLLPHALATAALVVLVQLGRQATS